MVFIHPFDVARGPLSERVTIEQVDKVVDDEFDWGEIAGRICAVQDNRSGILVHHVSFDYRHDDSDRIAVIQGDFGFGFGCIHPDDDVDSLRKSKILKVVRAGVPVTANPEKWNNRHFVRIADQSSFCTKEQQKLFLRALQSAMPHIQTVYPDRFRSGWQVQFSSELISAFQGGHFLS